MFLGYCYNNCSYFITLISKVDLERMLSFTKSLEPKSLSFYYDYQRGLASAEIIYLPKWRNMNNNKLCYGSTRWLVQRYSRLGQAGGVGEPQDIMHASLMLLLPSLALNSRIRDPSTLRLPEVLKYGARDKLHVIALNNEELHALITLHGQLFIQKALERGIYHLLPQPLLSNIK